MVKRRYYGSYIYSRWRQYNDYICLDKANGNKINSAVHYLVPDNATFDALTNQEKLDILYADARMRILSLAHTYDVNAATEAARIAAEATAANIDL